jgi:hypothetical protein
VATACTVAIERTGSLEALRFIAVDPSSSQSDRKICLPHRQQPVFTLRAETATYGGFCRCLYFIHSGKYSAQLKGGNFYHDRRTPIRGYVGLRGAILTGKSRVACDQAYSGQREWCPMIVPRKRALIATASG